MLDSKTFSSLALASAAHTTLRPAEQRFTLSVSDRITLADASAFLASKGVHSELRAGFGTADQRVRLRHAVDLFEERLGQWLGGSRQDPRVAWLAPSEAGTEETVTAIYRTLLERDDYQTFVELHKLLRLSNAPRWTPFVSVESIRIARSVTYEHRVRLERAFELGAASLGLSESVRPWSADHDLMDALPASWLYQFQPTQELGALLTRAGRARLYNVGHLSILDPTVRKLSSSKTLKAVRTAVALRDELEL